MALKETLQIPECSTDRLCELKIAMIELETKNRVENNIEILERKLQEVTNEFLKVKQDINQQMEQKTRLENKMLKQISDAKYYNSLIDRQKLEPKRIACNELENKKNLFEDLKNSLDFYKHFEPSNEALQAKIDELKNSRISLSELTFIDAKNNSPI